MKKGENAASRKQTDRAEALQGNGKKDSFAGAPCGEE
jgi:hypothetical protein